MRITKSTKINVNNNIKSLNVGDSIIVESEAPINPEESEAAKKLRELEAKHADLFDDEDEEDIEIAEPVETPTTEAPEDIPPEMLQPRDVEPINVDDEDEEDIDIVDTKDADGPEEPEEEDEIDIEDDVDVEEDEGEAIANVVADSEAGGFEFNYRREGKIIGDQSESATVLASKEILSSEEKSLNTESVKKLKKLLEDHKCDINTYDPIVVETWDNDSIGEYNRLIEAIKFERSRNWSDSKEEVSVAADIYAMSRVPLQLWPEIRFDSAHTVRQLIKKILHTTNKKDISRWYRCAAGSDIMTDDGELIKNPNKLLNEALALTFKYYNDSVSKQAALDYLEFYRHYFEYNSTTKIPKRLLNKSIVVVHIRGIGYKAVYQDVEEGSPFYYNSYVGMQKKWSTIREAYKKIWESIPGEFKRVLIGKKPIRENDSEEVKAAKAKEAEASAKQIWEAIKTGVPSYLDKIIDTHFQIDARGEEAKEQYTNARNSVRKAIKWAINPSMPMAESSPVSLVAGKPANIKARISLTPKANRRQEVAGNVYQITGQLNNAIVNVLSALDIKKPDDINVNAIANLRQPIEFYKSRAEIGEKNEKTYLPTWDDEDLLTLERLFSSALPSAAEDMAKSEKDIEPLEEKIRRIRELLLKYKGRRHHRKKTELSNKVRALKNEIIDIKLKAAGNVKSPNKEEWDRNFQAGKMYPSKTPSPTGVAASKTQSLLGMSPRLSQDVMHVYINKDTNERELSSEDPNEVKSKMAANGMNFDEYFEYVGPQGSVLNLGRAGKLGKIESAIAAAEEIRDIYDKYKVDDFSGLQQAGAEEIDKVNQLFGVIKKSAQMVKPGKAPATPGPKTATRAPELARDPGAAYKRSEEMRNIKYGPEDTVEESINGMITSPTTIVVNNSAFKLNYGDRLIIDNVSN